MVPCTVLAASVLLLALTHAVDVALRVAERRRGATERFPVKERGNGPVIPTADEFKTPTVPDDPTKDDDDRPPRDRITFWT